jgi:hypothetical protein
MLICVDVLMCVDICDVCVTVARGACLCRCVQIAHYRMYAVDACIAHHLDLLICVHVMLVARQRAYASRARRAEIRAAAQAERKRQRQMNNLVNRMLMDKVDVKTVCSLRM